MAKFPCEDSNVPVLRPLRRARLSFDNMALMGSSNIMSEICREQGKTRRKGKHLMREFFLFFFASFFTEPRNRLLFHPESADHFGQPCRRFRCVRFPTETPLGMWNRRSLSALSISEFSEFSFHFSISEGSGFSFHFLICRELTFCNEVALTGPITSFHHHSAFDCDCHCWNNDSRSLQSAVHISFGS